MQRVLRKMGRYALLDKLGQGSMGVVYKAYDEMLDRYVALKTMASDMNTDADLRKRFYQEARLAAKLNHPHIITVYDLGEVEGQIYIAMELLEGTDLKTMIREGLNLTVEQKLDWMIQLCEAFAFAHQDGIIHRDIKPGNIHIRSNGELVVMDFGIAKAATSDITKAGMIIGTPEYISPEQILAIRVDHRADIFSLGLVFYELMTNQHPFRSPNLPATIHKILNEKPVPPREINSQIPARLEALVLKAIEKDVNYRYQSCNEMLEELLAARNELANDAKALLETRNQNQAELLKLIGRLQELYPRKEFLSICEEVGYDPSTGNLSGNPVEIQMNQEVTYSQAAQLFEEAERRLNVAKQRLEHSAHLEGLMQEGKALYANQQYEECLQKMNAILEYYSGHELAVEYIKQCELRLQEQHEAEQRRARINEAEQRVMAMFQSSDMTNCQREALRLLEYDPQNTIARNYLKRCDEKLSVEAQEAERKRTVSEYIHRATTMLNEKRFAECTELLRTCEQLDPRNMEVKSLLTQCQNAVKQEQQNQKKQLVLHETINRAISLRNKGELAKSLDVLLEARKMAPESAEISREIQMTEQEIRASEEYQKKFAARVIPVWIYPSIILMGAAIVFFVWWLMVPHSPYSEKETREILALAQQKSDAGQYEESFKILQDYAAKDPTNPDAQRMLTDVKNKIAQERKNAQLAEIDTKLKEAQKELEAGNYQNAIAQYEAILQIDPLNKEAQEQLTAAKKQIAATTSARKLDEEVQKRIAEARNDIAAGQYTTARLKLNEAIELQPGNEEAKKMLDAVDTKLRDQETVQASKTRVNSLIASARSEIQKGRYDRALSHTREALKLDPHNSEAISLEQQIRSEQAKPRFGSITINCEPFGTAYIDGEKIGETPVPLRKLPAGSHTVTIRREGYKEISQTVVISDGQTQHLQFTLQKQ